MAKRGPLLLAAVALLVSGVLSFYAAHTVTSANKQVCQQVEVLRSSIYTTLQRSQKLLGKKGGAGYEYYHEHPVELAQARIEIASELKEFQPLTC